MATARIFKPSRTATQSGRAKTQTWMLEYEPGLKHTDPLMGWTGSENMLDQVRMKFPSKEAAIRFAQSNGLDFEVQEPRPRQVQQKSYAARFRSPLTG